MSLIKVASLIKYMSKAQGLPKKAVRRKAVERVKEPNFGLALGLALGQADRQADKQAVKSTSPAKAMGKAKRPLVPRRVYVCKKAVDQAVEQAQEAVQAPEQVIPTRSGRKPLKKVIFEAGKN